MGLILDPSVVIASERRGETVECLIERVVGVTGDQEAALSAIGLTELIHGLYRAQTQAVRLRRQSFLDELLRDLTVYPYTKETAMLAGKLDGEQQSKGVVIPFGDLLIGATALSLSFSVLTENLRHFQKNSRSLRDSTVNHRPPSNFPLLSPHSRARPLTRLLTVALDCGFGPGNRLRPSKDMRWNVLNRSQRTERRYDSRPKGSSRPRAK